MSPRRESNPRPRSYQERALPLSHLGIKQTNSTKNRDRLPETLEEKYPRQVFSYNIIQIMKEIVFVTSNKGKVQSLVDKLPPNKYKVIHKNIILPELQGNNARDISQEKAKEAYKVIKKPLIIQDSAFHINALSGFPGPYIKYVQETLGLKGLLKLMEGISDRSCYFEQAVTYIDAGTIKTFVSDKKNGTLATSISSTDSTRAWGLIWKLFIPEGHTKTISEISEDELSKYDKKVKIKSEFTYFIEWLLSGKNT